MPGRRPRSPTRRTCAAPSTRSSRGSAGASTSRARWSTPGCPTARRVNAIIPPLALDGSALTIRKFATDPLTVRRPDPLQGSLTPEMRATSSTRACGAGSTSSSPAAPAPGKTTTPEHALVASSRTTSGSSRSRTPPSSSSSRTTSSGSRPARPTSRARARSPIRDLVKNALRMRPDRIIIGECRGAETLDMLQAMNTGHDGSMTTAPRQRPARHARRAGDHGQHGRHRPADPRHPRAVRLGRRPDRPARPASRTARAGSRTSPRSSGWRAT